MATPERIKKEVNDNLYWDARIEADNVKVDVNQTGKVTLSGTVPSFRAKSSATSSAWVVNGVTDVNNQLDVNYPETTIIPSDKELKTNIENSILWDADLDFSKIDVSVDNNEVTLEGTVDAYWKRWRAQAACDLMGVMSINNKIAVVPTETESDERIAETIVNSLSRKAIVDAGHVEVKVKNGKVTLRGDVSSWAEYREAEDSATYTAGVADVDNLLEIKY